MRMMRAVPIAVPSCAPVFTMPAALPAKAAGTLVPRPVAATEAAARPRPITATPAAIHGHEWPRTARTALPHAMVAAPTAANRSGPSRGAIWPVATDPPMTARLNAMRTSPDSSAGIPRRSWSTSVASTDDELVVAVLRNDCTDPRRRLVSRNASRGTSGERERRSRQANNPAITRLRRISPTPCGCVACASSRAVPAMTGITAATRRTAPRTSSRSARPGSGSSRTTRATPTNRRAATGALTQNTDGQPSTVVSSPPIRNPVAPAAAPTALQAARARDRPGPAAVAWRISRSADGADTAAAAPWTARAMSTCGSACAVPPMIDTTPKTTIPTRRILR